MPDRIETAPCGYASFRDDGVIAEANATLATWLGETPDALVGRKLESILTVPGRIFLQTHLFPMLALHGQADEIFLSLRAGDETIPVIASVRRRIEAGGALNVAAFLTVRERRKYEDEILQAKRVAEETLRNNEELQAAKNELEQRARQLERHLRDIRLRNEDLERVTQILSHDLREPLRKVRLFAELVDLGEGAPTAETKAALAKIGSSAAQMDVLIAAMRGFLSTDSSGPIEIVDLADTVLAAAVHVRAAADFGDWEFAAETLPKIEGRRADLKLLFFHLLQNAVKFREPKRKLRVRVVGRLVQENVFEALKDRYHYSDFVQIEVTDNGRGFDPKYRGYVFRLLKKVELESPGLGVGLALCRKIVAAHYGTIDVESTPDTGTTFRILLPLRHER